jgi:hypothetical protein
MGLLAPGIAKTQNRSKVRDLAARPPTEIHFEAQRPKLKPTNLFVAVLLSALPILCCIFNSDYLIPSEQ